MSAAPDGRRAATLAASVGSVALANPVLTASGTSGHGTELSEYGRLADLGAVVVKSLSVEPWPGNPAPRVHEVGAGMLNSVGLQGPGLAAWVTDDLPALGDAGPRHRQHLGPFGLGVRAGGRAGRRGRLHAGRLVHRRARGQRQLPQRRGPFAHVRPLGASHGAGPRGHGLRRAALGQAEPERAGPGRDRHRRAGRRGRRVDAREHAAGAGPRHRVGSARPRCRRRRPVRRSGAPGGGAAVWECRSAFPEVPIVGVGGVFSGHDAVELLVAGADAVQVGTATFRDPRAPWKVLRQLARWCDTHATTVADIRDAVRQRVGAVRGRPGPVAAGAAVPSRREGGPHG